MASPRMPWAGAYRSVGVTGTNGKTSTTLLVASCLRAAGHATVVQTTLGYDVEGEQVQGHWHALELGASRGCDRAAIEVTSEALARGFAQQWAFDVGVFTNLSRDHLDSHGSWEHYLASKAQLFLFLRPGNTAVFNASDDASKLLDEVTPSGVVRLWYAVPWRGEPRSGADLQATGVDLGVDGTVVRLAPSPIAELLGGELRTSLVGYVYAENALGAALAAHAMGVDGSTIRRGIALFEGVPGRFEVVCRRPVIAIDYAHTPDALARTCDTARALATGGRVIVVFGAGGERDEGKREPMGRVVGERADVAIITTDNPRREDPRQIAKAVGQGCRRGGRSYVVDVADRRKAIERAIEEARAGDVVVIAGKGHESGQTIGAETLPFSDHDVVRKLVGAT